MPLNFDFSKKMNKQIVYKNTKAASINCKEKIIDFAIPKVMGILNLTPDSFYDGGKNNSISGSLTQCELMLKQGADIIDIGAFSSRPGAELPKYEEERKRLIPILKQLVKSFNETIFSIDTFRSEIAKEAVENGASIINDISGGQLDKNMFQTIAKLKVPYVLMHMNGIPGDMQKNPIDKNETEIVFNFFKKKVDELNALGVREIILDPGYGFGKSLEANYRLLKNQEQLRYKNLSILSGISRKSMISNVLDITPIQALNGTTTLNLLALQNGANILRVHDVNEAIEAIKLYEFYKNA